MIHFARKTNLPNNTDYMGASHKNNNNNKPKAKKTNKKKAIPNSEEK